MSTVLVTQTSPIPQSLGDREVGLATCLVVQCYKGPQTNLASHSSALWVKLKKLSEAGWWWRMPLIPGRQRQVDLCEFEASLFYRASSRTARITQRNPVTGRKKTTTTTTTKKRWENPRKEQYTDSD